MGITAASTTLTAAVWAAIGLVPAAPDARNRGPALSSTKEVPLRIQPTRFLNQGAVSPGWVEPGFDDHTWPQAAGVIVPRADLSPGATAPAAATTANVSGGRSLFIRVPFAVEDLSAVRSLELRITYQDGFVAYLNGVELVRRNLPGAPEGARPLAAHGSDSERIFLPVARPPRNVPSALPLVAATAALRPEGNLLAIEVRPAAGRAPVDSNAPAAAVDLAAFTGVRVVRGPYLIAPAEGAVSVAWETDLPARGSVWIKREGGPPTAPPREMAATKPSLRQVVRLTGLSPATRYQYRVHAQSASSHEDDRALSAPASFTTAPARDQPLRFIVYGDMRAPGHAVHAQVVAAILRERPALVVNTGDLVAVGAEESAWQRYFDITAALGAVAPVAPALGNHEAYVGGSAKSWALFGLRSAAPAAEKGSQAGYQSFDWGGAHFVILDSNRPEAAQRDWLARDLEKARAKHPRAIFAFCHDGPWSFAVHGGSGVMERLFAPVLAAAGTDVLFSGHDHIYARGVGSTARGALPFVVTGGGGAPLYNPTCDATSPPPGAIPPGPQPAPLPACPATVALVRKAYHYVVVEVEEGKVRLCPRLADGSALEPCVDRPVGRPRRR